MTPLSASTALVAPSRLCMRQQLATSASDVCDRHPHQRHLPPCGRLAGRANSRLSKWTAAYAGSGLGLRRLWPPPMAIVPHRLEVGASGKAEKRCRTATPWPFALCSALLVGFRNHAVMTASEASEDERDSSFLTPSREVDIHSL